MYGSIFKIVTLSPRLSKRAPMEAAANPFPKDDTTPPVTKIYLVLIVAIATSQFDRRFK